ncbi:MAG: SDR family NAD(P)-dependent oxidoreductase [Actinomycetota bacterium]
MVAWRRALVTGASSGIGAALCRLLDARSTGVVLVGRSRERLSSVADSLTVESEVLVADLSSASGRERVCERVAASARPIDLLVNNAAIGASGWWDEIEPARNLEMIDTNVIGVQQVLDAFLAATRRHDRRPVAVVNIASGAAEMRRPRQAVYAATKAYVLSVTQSLHDQCAAEGIHVSCVVPGFTRTGFHDIAGYTADDLPAAEAWREPEDVAAAILRAADDNEAVIRTAP